MTSTALDLNHHQAGTPAALAIQPGQVAWDSTQIAALGQLGLTDASDGDRSVFLHVCQRTGLDPFARQIYMIGRNEKRSERRNGQWVDVWTKKWTIQTGIEGWRVVRDRAEKRAGVRAKLGRAIWYDYDGNEYKVWVQQRPPAACEITLTVRDSTGDETPYTSVLQYAEYVQTRDSKPIAQWAVKPSHMLEKCTEADVYRKAFPQDFSGIYLDDAMPQDTQPADGTPDGPPRGRVTAGEVLDRGTAEPSGPQDEPKPAARTVRRRTAAAGDDTTSRSRHAAAAKDRTEGPADTAGEGRRTSADPRAAGATSPRGAQPLPPLPGEDETPAAAVPDETPASGPAAAAGLEPGEAAEYGTERHRKVVGIVWAHLQRLGYPNEDKETDEQKRDRLADVAKLASVSEIGSTNDLDLGELSTVADTLARCKDRKALDALLNAGEMAGEDGG